MVTKHYGVLHTAHRLQLVIHQGPLERLDFLQLVSSRQDFIEVVEQGFRSTHFKASSDSGFKDHTPR